MRTPFCSNSLPVFLCDFCGIAIFACGAVSLFGSVVYLFIKGAQQLGWPPAAHVVILVVISGIFAWLMKRISDIISEVGQRWFPGEVNDGD